MANYMKKPCQHCPFRHDVKPFLHPKRGQELAYHSHNRYNSFPCHKTTESYEDEDGTGRMGVTENSKECHGFMVLQANETGCKLPDGFEPSDLIYEDAWAMSEAYHNQ
jgi:hypothetical protein